MSDGPLLDVISIGKVLDQGLEVPTYSSASTNLIWDTNQSYGFIHNRAKNPLIAELPDGYGADITFSSQSNLPYYSFTQDSHNTQFTVWETKPFESALDIYYETLTCGLISTLNTEILSDSATQATSIIFDGDDAANPARTTSFAEGLDALDRDWETAS